MIGMMYLFYTALLALNVSGEIMDAFVLVDRGIRKTTENYSQKTSSLYAKIDAKAAEQPAKYGALKVQAEEIQNWSNSFFNNIDRLKLKCMQMSDATVTSVDSLPKKKDDINAAPGVMTAGPGPENKMADSLRIWMDTYRESLLALPVFKVNPKDPNSPRDTATTVYKGILSNLDVVDERTDKGGLIRWEEKFSLHMPLIGTLALLSKLQSDIRNVEAEVLTYMVAQLEGLDIRITSLEGLVSAPKSFILSGSGQPYISSIFLGARDTTMRPTVWLTTEPPFFDSTIVNGELVFKKVDGKQYDTVPLDETGKGKYVVENPSVGEHVYGGLVHYASNVGDKWLPYTGNYTVGTTGITASATKMNVFYKGLDNPFSVTVAGYSSGSVNVSIPGASVSRTSGGWNVRIPASFSGGKVRVTATASEGGSSTSQSMEFRVLNCPTPVVKLGHFSSGLPIQKNLIGGSLTANLADPQSFPLEGLKYTVKRFTVLVSANGRVMEEHINGATLTPKIITTLKGLSAGQVVAITNIMCTGPSGEVKASDFTFSIR